MNLSPAILLRTKKLSKQRSTVQRQISTNTDCNNSPSAENAMRTPRISNTHTPFRFFHTTQFTSKNHLKLRTSGKDVVHPVDGGMIILFRSPVYGPRFGLRPTHKPRSYLSDPYVMSRFFVCAIYTGPPTTAIRTHAPSIPKTHRSMTN